KAVLLEALLDDGQDLPVDEPRDGLLHHALLFGERARDIIEIEWIQRHDNSRFPWMLLMWRVRHRDVTGRRRWPSLGQKPRFLPETRWAGQEPGSSAYTSILARWRCRSASTPPLRCVRSMPTPSRRSAWRATR